MKHTPEPWAVLNLGEIQRIYISGGDIICDVKGGAQRANARLIAAAPELLAALQAMIDGWNHYDNTCERHYGDSSKIDAAESNALKIIKKATGETTEKKQSERADHV